MQRVWALCLGTDLLVAASSIEIEHSQSLNLSLFQYLRRNTEENGMVSDPSFQSIHRQSNMRRRRKMTADPLLSQTRS